MSPSLVRVATFNIHHGLGRDGRIDLARTADVMGDLNADLISLQELDVDLERSGNVDQPVELARRTGMDVHYFPTLGIDKGSYGIALAARETVPCAMEPLPRLLDEEPRIAIVGRWREISVVCTHLSRRPDARSGQIEALAELVARSSTPLVVAGDLNQGSRDLGPLIRAGLSPVALRRPLGNRFRRPLQIDHILLGPGLRAVDAMVVPTSASDHDPMVATIERDAMRGT